MATRSRRQGTGFDLILLACYVALVIIGLLMIYTTTYSDHPSASIWSIRSAFGAQALWAVLSLLGLTFFTILEWRVWQTLSYPAYVGSLLLLVLLFVIGKEVKGAQSWISFGSYGLQPSEFAKLTTILICASLLSSIRINLGEIKSQSIMMAVIMAPAVLIILQPDPGSALTFLSLLIVFYRFGMPQKYYLALLSTFLVVVFSLTQGFWIVSAVIFLLGVMFTTSFSRKNPTAIYIFVSVVLTNILLYQFDLAQYALALNTIYFFAHLYLMGKAQSFIAKAMSSGALIVLTLISLGSSFAFNSLLKPHQQDRINVWLQPEKCDPRGSLYNLLQSKLAIGSGGWTGKGYLEGTLTKLNYVPEQTTDFIFSSIGEEQGFLGSVGVVILFLIMTLRLIRIGENSQFGYVRAYCYGVAGLIFVHFFINIGMTMGISPVIGIPLPFVSKGGSALLAFSLMIGIALNMSRE